jgi:hypothetical protein
LAKGITAAAHRTAVPGGLRGLRAGGFFGRSGLVWLFFLLSLGNWFGAETGYMSGWGAYWLGMNYPVRFIFFGGALLALCWVLRAMLQARHLYTTSKAMGLTYLFVAVDHVDFWQLRCG